MTDNLSNIAKILIKDTNFIKTVEGNIKFIMKDGKVDIHDIPEIISIVTESYNNIGTIKLTYEQLPEILSEVIDFIFTKYDVIPNDQEEKFKKMIDMVIKLVMLKPKVKKGCLKVKKFLCS
jgi:hypothetical protein